VSGEQSSEVLKRPLHSGYPRQQPTSTISQPASADCTALSEDYIRPSGFLCGRMQARRSGTHYRPSFAVCPSVLATLDARLRRYCSRDVSALSAIEMLCIILRYINFLFYSIPQLQLDWLQSVLNTAARLLVGAKKHDHIKHVLRDRAFTGFGFGSHSTSSSSCVC